MLSTLMVMIRHPFAPQLSKHINFVDEYHAFVFLLS